MLLFAPGIDGLKPLSPLTETMHIGAYVQSLAGPRGEETLGKIVEAEAAKAAAMNSLLALNATRYDEQLAELKGATVLTMFHAKFCKECPPILQAFAEASKALADEGWSSKQLTLAHLDTAKGGSRFGGAGAVRYARPCPDCGVCSGYPCFNLLDIDEEGVAHPVKAMPSDKLKGLRAKQKIAQTVRDHAKKRGLSPDGSAAPSPPSPHTAAARASLRLAA